MAEYIDTYCHQNRIGAIVRFRCDDPWAFKTTEFKQFSRDVLYHIVATDSEELLFFQPYYRDANSTVGDKLIDISKLLGVKVKLIEFKRLQIEEKLYA